MTRISFSKKRQAAVIRGVPAGLPPSIGGGSGGGGGTTALVAASIAALGAGPFADGTLAVIRIPGTAPDHEYIELVRDAVTGMWVSRAETLVIGSDLGYMGQSAGGGATAGVYDYVDTFTSGGAQQIAWTTRPIRKASSILAAGLRLQACFTAVIKPSSTNAVTTVQARFFHHNDGEAVTFSADGSTAVGELGTALVSPGSAGSFLKSTGWADVVQLGNASVLTSTQVTKQNLWPRLYMKNASGTSPGEIIDQDLQVRWAA